MTLTLAFDVYGTLIDTHGVVVQLQKLIGARATAFSRTWREKQLEYSFRRGLMEDYRDFSVCTSHALDYTDTYYKTFLSDKDKLELLAGYRTLPAFEDVTEGLSALQKNNKHSSRLYAFSNGREDAVETLLVTAGLRIFFRGIVSVDDLQSFKPNPAVYKHFMQKTGSTGGNTWLISSNPFDVIGAISAGMCAAWVNRTGEAIFDPWGIEPTLTVKSISELNEKLYPE